jgi:hypothetical protein
MPKEKTWLAKLVRTLLWVLLSLVVLAVIAYAVVMMQWANPPAVSHQAALADFDQDGDLDALLANGVNEGRTESTIWINQGGAQAGRMGKFLPGQSLGSAEYQNLAVGDLNSDGDMDILLGNTWVALELFINQGGTQAGETGQFMATNPLVGGGYWGGPHPIGLGDLDGDGDLDIVTGNCCGGLMMHDDGEPEPLPPFNVMWMNQTAEEGLPDNSKIPAFQSVSPPEEGLGGTQALALGDLDGDSDLDVFLAKAEDIYEPEDKHSRQTAYRVWLNDGSGGMGSTSLTLENPGVTDLALGDLDGDGDLDGVAATQRGGQVILNQGGLQLGLPAEFAIRPGMIGGRSCTSVFLGDFNDDGSLDVLLGSLGQAQIWLNDGLGNFDRQPTALHYGWRNAVTAGDVNGDGTLDIFSARLDEVYRVWLNDGSGKFPFPGW